MRLKPATRWVRTAEGRRVGRTRGSSPRDETTRVYHGASSAAMNELSWRWIVVMLIAPLPVGMLAATPLWRRRETILGNLAGSAVILGAAFALIFRESAMLDALRQACFDAGGVVCWPTPSAFTRYALYASIGLAETLTLFAASLTVERRLRERDYAPEWRR